MQSMNFKVLMKDGKMLDENYVPFARPKLYDEHSTVESIIKQDNQDAILFWGKDYVLSEEVVKLILECELVSLRLEVIK